MRRSRLSRGRSRRSSSGVRATSDSVELYGVAGAVLLVPTWLYLGGLTLLFGAVLNAVLAGRVDAEEGWLPTEDIEG